MPPQYTNQGQPSTGGYNNQQHSYNSQQQGMPNNTSNSNHMPQGPGQMWSNQQQQPGSQQQQVWMPCGHEST